MTPTKRLTDARKALADAGTAFAVTNAAFEAARSDRDADLGNLAVRAAAVRAAVKKAGG
jgi:hypothetical protein